MKRFVVSITELNYGTVVVDASNAEEAKIIAKTLYYDGQFHWTDSEISEISVDEDKL